MPLLTTLKAGGDVFRDEFSLEFDGSDDYIDLGASLSLGTGDFTISIWAKVNPLII